MNKTLKYKGVAMTIERHDAGEYIVRSTYKGYDIAVATNNSEIWDYCDADVDEIKVDKGVNKLCAMNIITSARRSAYRIITETYNNFGYGK